MVWRKWFEEIELALDGADGTQDSGAFVVFVLEGGEEVDALGFQTLRCNKSWDVGWEDRGMVEKARTRSGARSWRGSIAVLAALAGCVLVGMRGWGDSAVGWCPSCAEVWTTSQWVAEGLALARHGFGH